MARVLIVGCGCRGLELARLLIDEGHSVRGTTRDPARVAEIEAAGVEAFVGDPDRIGTLVYALEHVTITCWLLGTAAGEEEAVAALHTTRLDRMVEEVIDTTVRGFVYEGAGSVPATVLAEGTATARRSCAASEIPLAVLHADPADHAAWLESAAHAVRGLLQL